MTDSMPFAPYKNGKVDYIGGNGNLDMNDMTNMNMLSVLGTGNMNNMMNMDMNMNFGNINMGLMDGLGLKEDQEWYE